MIVLLLFASFAAMVVAAIATRVGRDAAIKGGRLDEPEARKVHVTAVPRVGGIGIAAGVAAGSAVLLFVTVASGRGDLFVGLVPVLVGAAAVFALGLWDDLYGLGFKWRFAVQAGVAWAMTLCGWHVDLSNVPLVEQLGVFEQAAISVPLTVVWTVGLINAMNLLDGLDTLAAGTAIIGFVALALAFLPANDAVLMSLCVVGVCATIGFLTYNRSPATIFMGDGGSTLLGFLLAMAGVRGVASMPSGGLVILPVIALGLPILDTLTQMIRRVAAGESPFLPDRDHLHHRAFDRSGSTTVAVRKLHLTAVGFGVLAIVLRLAAGFPWIQGVILLATVLFGYYVVRRLGYVKTRDVMQSIRHRARRRMLRPTDLPTPSGDGATVEAHPELQSRPA